MSAARAAGLRSETAALAAAVIVAPNTAFLPKPFTIRQLTERVREVLDSAG